MKVRALKWSGIPEEKPYYIHIVHALPQNLFLRYGYAHNLTFALAEKGHYLGNPKHFEVIDNNAFAGIIKTFIANDNEKLNVWDTMSIEASGHIITYAKRGSFSIV